MGRLGGDGEGQGFGLARLRVRADELARLIRELPDGGERFVVVESLFSMDGDIAPLADYARVCRSAGASLVVDEAHAVGIFGPRGSGLIEAAGVEAE